MRTDTLLVTVVRGTVRFCAWGQWLIARESVLVDAVTRDVEAMRVLSDVVRVLCVEPEEGRGESQ